jgi:hypothetical protein
MPHGSCALEMPNVSTAPALKDGYRASESLQNQGVIVDSHRHPKRNGEVSLAV